MSFHTENLRLYAVTDRTWVGKMTFLEQIEAALKNGVTMLQLREKSISEDAFAAEALPVKKLCRQYNVPLIINDSVNVAVKIGADGVHVGMEDQPVADIRRQMGKDFIIGATAKTVKQPRQRSAPEQAIWVWAPFFHPLPRKTPFELQKSNCRKLPPPCPSPALQSAALRQIISWNCREAASQAWRLSPPSLLRKISAPPALRSQQRHCLL